MSELVPSLAEHADGTLPDGAGTNRPRVPASDPMAGSPALERAIGEIGDAFIVLDREWRLQYFNAAYEKMVRPLYTPDQMRGRNIWALFPDLEGSDLAKFYEERMTQQTPGEFTMHYDPLQVWVEIRAYPTAEYLSLTVRDITERKHQEKRSGRRFERTQLLSMLLGQLLEARDPEGLIRGLFPHVAAHLDVDTYFNFMVNAEGTALQLHSCAGIPEEEVAKLGRLEFGQAICGTVAQLRKAIVAEDIQHSDYDKANLVRGFGIQCYACNPLMVGGRLLGTLSFASHTRPTFDAEELDFLRVVSQYAAVALDRLRSAEQLHQSEQVYRAIGESINYGIWVCDPDGKNIYASESFLKLVGMTEQEGMENGWAGALHPDDREATMAAWAECARTGAFWEREHRVLGVDGEYHPILARGVAVRDDKGKIIHWVGINLDVAAYKKTEADLKNRTKTLETINRLGMTVAGVLDTRTVVQAVTDAAREISGAAFGAFFYNTINERGEAFVLYTLSGAPREAFEKFGMPRNTALFGPTFRGEGVVRVGDVRKDARYGSMGPHHGMPPGHLPVRSYMAVPVISRSGDVLGGLLLGHPEPDVFTPEMEPLVTGIAAQAAIAMDNADLFEKSKRDTERLRIALSASALGDWSWDATSDTVAFSDMAADLFGVPHGSRLGWEERQKLVHPEDRQQARAAMLAAVERSENYHAEYRIVREDGEVVWLASWGRPTFAENGEVIGMLGVAQDITERRKAEANLREAKDAAEAASRSKDRFLAVLSHELRTPLTPVLMTAAVYAADASLPAQMKEDMGMIRRNVELETKIIDDLLDLSRITAGKLNLRTEVLDLNNVARQVCEICLAQIHEKRLKLHFHPATAAVNVLADPSRLQQVVWNVLKNAIKFTPEGGDVMVRTSVEAGKAQLTVRDTGRGIEADILPRVFDAFEQGDEKITRQFGGLGLGLAISKALIDLHHGSIRADSAGEGRGSVFTIELSCTEAAPVEQPAERVAPRNTQPFNLLVVEDHADTAMMLARFLEMAGFTVQTADSVAAALALTARQKFDVIVSDIGLPDAPGYDLMSQLRKTQPELIGIAMSGYGMEEDVRRSIDAGFAEHLVKPVSVTVLVQTLQRVTGNA